MQSVKSFDRLLMAILLVIGVTQMLHGLAWAPLLYVLLASISLLIIRWVIDVKTTKEALSWMRSNVRIAIYLLIILVSNAIYVGYSFWDGHVGLIEAIGVYFFVITLFSAIMLLGEWSFQYLFNAFVRKK